MLKILAITQARYGSTRLPAKILKEANGKTLLEIHLRRIFQAKTVSQLKIATTDEEGAKYIVEVADKVGVGYHKGSVDDVLSRFYGTAAAIPRTATHSAKAWAAYTGRFRTALPKRYLLGLRMPGKFSSTPFRLA